MSHLKSLSSPAPQASIPCICTALRIVPHRLFGSLLAILGIVLALPARADIPAGERAVLLALYSSTGGANWTHNAGWNGPPGTECLNWDGVMCDAGHNHVTKLSGNTNNLIGTLPSIAGLTELESFQAVNNHLTGRIPPLSGMTKLQLILLSDNQLSGSIPALAGLAALVNFTAHSNQLSGSIPQLTGLSNLRGIDVHSNRLSGSLPSLAGLAMLRWVTLYNNQLSGDLPDVPHPNALLSGYSLLCLQDSNGFTHSPNVDWDNATGIAPWYLFCDSTPDPVSVNGFD